MRTRFWEWIASLIMSSGTLVVAGGCSDGGGPRTQPASSATVASPVDGDSPASRHGTTLRPSWATGDRFAGRLEADRPISLQIHLRMRDEDAAAAELAAISDPRSSRYGRFLSDEEFAARYAPTDEDLNAVRAHLEASGLRVTRVAASRAYLTAEGAASEVERAFATRLGRYQVGLSSRHAPIEEPTLPPAVADRVLTVLGLSTPLRMMPRRVSIGGLALDSDAPDAAPRVCSSYYGATLDTGDPAYGPGYPASLGYAPCGFTPPSVRAAYELDDAVEHGIDGSGRTVAIVDAYMSPTLLADAQAYAAAHDPSHPLASSQFSARWAPGKSTPVETGWYGEQSLDVEAVHAIAPGADIVYVGAQGATTPDLIAAVDLVVTDHLASIVSNSYGEAERGQPNDFTAWHDVALQAGLKGVGLYFASGDRGDESTSLRHPSVDFPASLDNATAVGGTSLALGESGERLWETGWETGISLLGADADAGTRSWSPRAPGVWLSGSGGGISVQYAQPWYQLLAVPPSLAEANGERWRVVPDVAMLADPVTGYLVGQTSARSGEYGEGVIGGTSLACPLFAATMALGEQLAGHRFGFANPLLYAVALDGALRDVLPLEAPQAVVVRAGEIATFDDETGLSIHVARGYDDVTGLGSPRGWPFLSSLAAF